VTKYRKDLIAGSLPFTIDDARLELKGGVWHAGAHPALHVMAICCLRPQTVRLETLKQPPGTESQISCKSDGTTILPPPKLATEAQLIN
jgi:hypothetical protein